MDYARYKKIGAGLIGSGAIESAQRTVVQKRLKQSGQRWGNSRCTACTKFKGSPYERPME